METQKKKLTNEEIEKILDEILYSEYRHMSIREMTTKLREDYGIRLAPITVLKHLQSLEKKGKTKEKENGKKI